MAEIRAEAYKDQIVLYFKTDGSRINAYTLATSLVSMADAIKRANDSINPGYEVEVVVQAIGPGSFKAVIRTVFKEVKNLFSADSLRTIILAIIATFIYEHAISPKQSVDVIVNTNEVIIDQGDNRIIVPRDVYEEKNRVTATKQFSQSVSQLFNALDEDEHVSGFGLSPYHDSIPEVIIPREVFDQMITVPPPDEDRRVVRELVELTILRAILERSSRKWQFLWNGIRVSAAITDDSFFDRFDSHAITIAPGDTLECEVLITQERDPISGVYENRSYEIARVVEHRPKPKHPELE